MTKTFRTHGLMLTTTSVLALAAAPGPVSADTDWVGGTGTDWFDGINWTAGVPDMADEVIIDTQTPNPTVIDGADASGDDVFVGNVNDGALTISGAGTLTAAGVTVASESGQGEVTVTGAGSELLSDDFVNVGQGGMGTLNVFNGGRVEAEQQVGLGDDPGATGILNVDGAGSSLVLTIGDNRLFVVGNRGTGEVNITNGGFVGTVAPIAIGGFEEGVGAVNISGTGSEIRSPNIAVGNLGTGTLTVSDGGSGRTALVNIGSFPSGDGTMTLTGPETEWLNSTDTSSAQLFAGANGTGTLDIVEGATFLNIGNADVGGFEGSNGVLTVDGPDSFLGVSGDFRVGTAGVGTLNVTGSGQIIAGTSGSFDSMGIGTSATGVGTANVDGTGSSLEFREDLRIGSAGAGTLNITGGGTVLVEGLDMGVEAGSNGTLMISGAGSSLTQLGDPTLNRIGDEGTASVEIADGGTATFDTSLYLGHAPGASATILVTGMGSVLNVNDFLNQDVGTTSMTIADGGTVNVTGFYGVGGEVGGDHSLTVEGPGTTLSLPDDTLYIAFSEGSNGSLRVASGGQIVSDGVSIGTFDDTNGTALITGQGTQITSAGTFTVGADGIGTATVSDRAVVETNRTRIGREVTGQGTLIVEGPGTRYLDSGNLFNNGTDGLRVGDDGTGVLTIRDTAVFRHTGTGGMTIGLEEGSSGTVNIGAGVGAAPRAAGTLDLGRLAFGAGESVLTFNHMGTGVSFGADLLGNGTINILGGTTLLTGNGSAMTGLTLVDGGNLQVTGSLGTDVRVETGTLSGTGSVGSAVVNGTISPGTSIGTLSVTGDFVLGSTGIMSAEIAGDGSSDLLDVSGRAALDGTLAVTGLSYPTGYPDSQSYVVLRAGAGVTGRFATVTDSLPDVDVQVAYNTNEAVVSYERGTSPPTPEPPTPEPPTPEPPTPEPPTPEPPTPEPPTPEPPTPEPPTPEPPTPEPPTPEPPTAPGGGFSDKSIHPNTIQSAARQLGNFNSTLMNRSARLDRSAMGNDAVSTRGASYGDTRRYSWTSVFGSRDDVDDTSSASGYEAATWGIASGVEAQYGTARGEMTLGFGLGVTDTSVTSARSSADVSAVQLGLYASHISGPLTVSGALSFGYQDYDFERIIPVAGGPNATAKGDTDGTGFAASLRASYDIASQMKLSQNPTFFFAPYAEVQYVRISMDGFTETGAGVLNLAVDDDTYSQTALGLGIDLGATHELAGGGTLRSFASFGWEHLVGDLNTTTTSTLATVGGAPFNSPGAKLGRDRLRVRLGLTADLSKGVTGEFGYDGSFSNAGHDHALRAGLKLVF